eukprot:6492317-Amphidinium_carterae.3
MNAIEVAPVGVLSHRCALTYSADASTIAHIASPTLVPFTSVHGAEATTAPSTPAAAISGRARSKLCGGWAGGAVPQYSPRMTISVYSMLGPWSPVCSACGSSTGNGKGINQGRHKRRSARRTLREPTRTASSHVAGSTSA